MHQINVSAVYATPLKQWRYEARVARGTSARELLEESGFLLEIDGLKELDSSALVLGVFAQKIDADYLLEEGDRVEVYRPLKADPKEVRRKLALLGKSIGKNKS